MQRKGTSCIGGLAWITRATFISLFIAGVTALILFSAAYLSGDSATAPRGKPSHGQSKPSTKPAEETAAGGANPATKSADPQQAHSRPTAGPQQALALDLDRLRRYAAALDPELLEHAAPDGKYDGSYRNPCWTDTRGFHCIPGVYFLGSFHSGVTSLTVKVSRHPDIVVDSMSHHQFWAEDGKKMEQFVDGFGTGAKAVQANPSKLIMEASQSTLAFYLSSGAKAHRHFSSVMSPCWRNCTERGGTAGENVEQCMATRCYPSAMAADKKVAKDHGFDYLLDQNVALLMRAVYAHKTPKLVAILRDPVDRLHSAYYGYSHYFNKHGHNPPGFLAYVKEQVAAFKACEASAGGRSADECALLFEALGVQEEKVYFHCDQLMRGMYAVYLERWLRFFDRKSMLIIKAEDMFKNQTRVLKDIFDFLEVPAPDEKLWDTIRFAGPSNSYAKGKEMLPEARKLVYDFYQPLNTRLSKLLNDPSVIKWNQL